MVWAFKDLVSFIIYIFILAFKKRKSAIIVYHGVEDTAYTKDPLKINVSPFLFEKQVKYLVKFKDRYVLTFDDGFESIYTNAFPILKRYSMSAILFITTDFIERRMNFDNFFDYKYSPAPLNWNQIKIMHTNGIEVGSHSLMHKNISSLDKELCYNEAFVSKSRIEEKIGCQVRYFSYPFGNRDSFNYATENILKIAGYEKAYINIMGMDNSSEEPFEIRRIRIYSTDNMFRFKMKIAGAYNWVDRMAYLIRREKCSKKN